MNQFVVEMARDWERRGEEIRRQQEEIERLLDLIGDAGRCALWSRAYCAALAAGHGEFTRDHNLDAVYKNEKCIAFADAAVAAYEKRWLPINPQWA